MSQDFYKIYKNDKYDKIFKKNIYYDNSYSSIKSYGFVNKPMNSSIITINDLIHLDSILGKIIQNNPNVKNLSLGDLKTLIGLKLAYCTIKTTNNINSCSNTDLATALSILIRMNNSAELSKFMNTTVYIFIKAVYSTIISKQRNSNVGDKITSFSTHTPSNNQDDEVLDQDVIVENKRVIDEFMKDIVGKDPSDRFRGWMLPNGLLLSQYNEPAKYTSNEIRQDHNRLFNLFMTGLQEYDNESYWKIQDLYDEYKKANVSADIGESFAVEVLGWMQISIFGQKKIVYRAERWQDRLLRGFLVDYGFSYEVSRKAKSHTIEFEQLYDHLDEIIQLGLQKKMNLKIS